MSPTTPLTKPRFHFVAAVENKPGYINMARLLAYSIRTRGGALADAKVTIVFNDQDDDGKTAALFREKKLNVDCIALPRISREFHYVNKYTALHTPKLRESADWIVQLDADTVIVDQLDELANLLTNPDLDFAAVPVLDCPVWGLDRIIQKYTEATPAQLDKSIHPWFPTTYPLFNGGVTFFRAQHLSLFRDQLLPLVTPIRNDMRLGGSPNPLRFLRNLWNRAIEKRPALHHLILSPYHAKNYADQIVQPVLIFKHDLNYHILPHAYNWRSPDAKQGESTPVRILHYLHARYPIDRDHLFNPNADWLRQYSDSNNPGQNALAKLIHDYNHWNES